MFGDGIERPSRGTITLPIIIEGFKVNFLIEKIDADVPLLIGNSTLEKAEAEINIKKQSLTLGGREFKLVKLPSGH